MTMYLAERVLVRTARTTRMQYASRKKEIGVWSLAYGHCICQSLTPDHILRPAIGGGTVYLMTSDGATVGHR